MFGDQSGREGGEELERWGGGGLAKRSFLKGKVLRRPKSSSGSGEIDSAKSGLKNILVFHTVEVLGNQCKNISMELE